MGELSPMFSKYFNISNLTPQAVLFRTLDSVKNKHFFENSKSLSITFYLYLSYTSINLEKINS